MDRSASNYSVGSGDSEVNRPASSYYPKPATPMDVKDHPEYDMGTANNRVKNAFQAIQDGDLDKPKQGMDDYGR